MKDNSLLVEFEFVVDLDLAMLKFIRENYGDSDMVNKRLINLKSSYVARRIMLNRKHINPLELLLPGQDSTQLYFDLINDKKNLYNLLMYAVAYDTFGLMVTYLKHASSVELEILCRNEVEEAFIKYLNPEMPTIVRSSRFDINLSKYTALYLKYFAYATNYVGLDGKNLYIAAAKFNMEEDSDNTNIELTHIYSQTNVIHLMDLDRRAKFRFTEEHTEDDAKGNEENGS